MNPRLSLAAQDVLLSVHEHSPLWEIGASLAERIGVDFATGTRNQAAEILRDFASRGWIGLHRRRIVEGDVVGPLTQVPLAKLDEVLSDRENWLLSAERPAREFDEWVLATTLVGDEAVEAGAADDAWPGLDV